MIWPPCWYFETQMLQPMHSRMSSKRPFGNLGRQERVGYRGPRGTDDVEHRRRGSGPPCRRDWSCRPFPTTGMFGAKRRLSLLYEGRHPSGLSKPRGARILAPLCVIADLEGHKRRPTPSLRNNSSSRTPSSCASTPSGPCSVSISNRVGDAASRPPGLSLSAVQQFDERTSSDWRRLPPYLSVLLLKRGSRN